MFSQKILIPAIVLWGMTFSVLAQTGSEGQSDGPGGSTVSSVDRAPSGPDIRIRQERTLTTADYFSSKLKAGEATAPGVPLSQIQGDTPPPGNNTMSRMISDGIDGKDGSLMGGHD